MEAQVIVKLRNPKLNYQKELRYIVTKVNRTTLHCRVVEYDKINNYYKDVHYGKDYKGISFNSVIEV